MILFNSILLFFLLGDDAEANNVDNDDEDEVTNGNRPFVLPNAG